jgi:hypothetical protein
VIEPPHLLPSVEELAFRTPQEAERLATAPLATVRGVGSLERRRKEVAVILALFEERAAEETEWLPVVKSWIELSEAYELEELTQKLEKLWALTRRHLPLLLDLKQNHIFNGLRLNRLYTRFYLNYPTAARPANEAGGVLLRDAAEYCRHEVETPEKGLSRCRFCPGWFSF